MMMIVFRKSILRPKRVGDRAFLQDLEEQVHHVRVRLFDFVEKHDASTDGGARLRKAGRLLRNRRSPEASR